MRPISYLEVMRIKSFGPNRTVGMTMGVVTMLLTAGLLTGCLHMRSTSFTSPQNLRLDSHAYPIVHHTITKATYHLDGLTVNADGGVISGEAQPLGPGHQTYRKANSRDGDLYKFNAFKEKPLNEVHFYVDAWNLEDGGLSFSTANIQRVDVYDLAVGLEKLGHEACALMHELDRAIVVLECDNQVYGRRTHLICGLKFISALRLFATEKNKGLLLPPSRRRTRDLRQRSGVRHVHFEAERRVRQFGQTSELRRVRRTQRVRVL